MEKDLIIGLVTFVLIETSWNVKLKNHTRQEHWRAVLIETSWNVKEDGTKGLALQETY